MDLAILVGCGSIGKKHLRILYAMYKHLIVVDSSKVVQQDLKKSTEFALDLRNDITELSEKEIMKSGLIVIATYGPDHLSQAQYFVNKGAKNFIIEKPLTDSLEDLNILKNLVDENSIKLYCHTPNRYTLIKENIIKIQNRYSLGELKSSVVVGGAKCMATMGIHYLDTMNHIIGDEPIEVFANLRNSSINPRGRNFVYLEGTAEWVYKNGFRFAIHFNNQIQLESTQQFIWQRAKLESNHLGRFDLMVTDGKNSQSDLIYKTAFASKFIESFNLYETPNTYDKFNNFYYCIANSDYKFNFDASINSTKSLFAALYSSLLGKRIYMTELDKLDQTIKWKIT